MAVSQISSLHKFPKNARCQFGPFPQTSGGGSAETGVIFAVFEKIATGTFTPSPDGIIPDVTTKDLDLLRSNDAGTTWSVVLTITSIDYAAQPGVTNPIWTYGGYACTYRADSNLVWVAAGVFSGGNILLKIYEIDISSTGASALLTTLPQAQGKFNLQPLQAPGGISAAIHFWGSNFDIQMINGSQFLVVIHKGTDAVAGASYDRVAFSVWNRGTATWMVNNRAVDGSIGTTAVYDIPSTIIPDNQNGGVTLVWSRTLSNANDCDIQAGDTQNAFFGTPFAVSQQRRLSTIETLSGPIVVGNLPFVLLGAQNVGNVLRGPPGPLLNRFLITYQQKGPALITLAVATFGEDGSMRYIQSTLAGIIGEFYNSFYQGAGTCFAACTPMYDPNSWNRIHLIAQLNSGAPFGSDRLVDFYPADSPNGEIWPSEWNKDTIANANTIVPGSGGSRFLNMTSVPKLQTPASFAPFQLHLAFDVYNFDTTVVDEGVYYTLYTSQSASPCPDPVPTTRNSAYIG